MAEKSIFFYEITNTWDPIKLSVDINSVIHWRLILSNLPRYPTHCYLNVAICGSFLQKFLSYFKISTITCVYYKRVSAFYDFRQKCSQCTWSFTYLCFLKHLLRKEICIQTMTILVPCCHTIIHHIS